MEKNNNDIYKFTSNVYRVIHYKDTCKYDPSKYEDVHKNDPFDFETIPTRIHNSWELSSETQGEDEYKKNYGNPLSFVYHHRFTIVVGKNESKTYIKLFEYTRTREQGKKYFRLRTMVNYISFNHVTNSLYVGYISNYHKKRKFSKRVRKNGFREEPLSRIKSIINSHLSGIGKQDSEILFKKSEIINKTIQSFLDNIPGSDNYRHLEPEEQLYRLHLDKWGVKLSNNWNAFSLSYPQPKKKDFVKNKMKYIDVIMNIHGLNGDKIKKVLHQVTRFQGTDVFRWASNFFGKDFLMSKEPEFLKQLFETTHYVGNHDNSDLLTKKEKENAFMIYKLCLIGEIDVNTFYDHIRMINRIKNFEEFKWDADNYTKFSEEHYDLSEKLGFYTQGDFTRKYNEEFINRVQEPMTLDFEYYPVLLSTSKEYNMESFVQSNCVKGYINRAESLIISLRRGSKDSKDRATIEFKICEINGKIVLRRVQTLGRFNQRLTPEWDDSIRLLDTNIEKITDEKLFKTPSVELKIGNKVMESNSVFKRSKFHGKHDELFLTWEKEGITNIQSRNNEVYLPNGLF